jgi:hypothetical protein
MTKDQLLDLCASQKLSTEEIVDRAVRIGVGMGLEAAAQLQEEECNCGKYGCRPVVRAKSIRTLDIDTIVKEGE